MAPQACMSQASFCCVCFSTQQPPCSAFGISPELWKPDQVRSYWKLRRPHPKPMGGDLIPNQYRFLKMASLSSRSSSCLLSFKKKIIFLVRHGGMCLQFQHWGVESKADLYEFKTRLVYLVSSRSVRTTWGPVSISRTHIKVEGEISSTKLSSDLHTHAVACVPTNTHHTCNSHKDTNMLIRS